MKKKQAIYMEVTPDKYELPVKIADSAVELAKLCGVSANNIYSSISHAKHRRQKRSRFVKVEI